MRLVQIFVPTSEGERLRSRLEAAEVEGYWLHDGDQQTVHAQALVEPGRLEAFSDGLEQAFDGISGFRVIILDAQAVLPRGNTAKPAEVEGQQAPTSSRISREELYADILAGTTIDWVFVAFVILSATVASIGLVRDNTAVIIGAMVMAPLLGPNVGLALASALGDLELGRKALKTNVVGVGIALGFSMLVGAFLHVDPLVHQEIASRTDVGLGEVVLALASGVAGGLAYTSGVSASLTGVMVAVALLPPLVVFGMLLIGGHWGLAFRAGVLLATNIASVNLAAVATFHFQGITPRNWYESKRATASARLAIGLWTGVLVALVVLILISAGLG